MSSKNRNVQVNMVRIQWSDKKNPITHKNNVTVGMVKHPDTKSADLRIRVDTKMIMSEELNNFQWLDDSCSSGVVTIDSPTKIIIIIYDAKVKESHDFFDEMEECLKQKPTSKSPEPSTPEDQTEESINDLVKSIEDGSSIGAERSAKYLARMRTNVQFNLTNHNDNKEKENTKQNSATETSSDILQLQLHVECHLDRKPLVATIYVASGTQLRALKEQIETETGINRKDQYWYAFDRYLISDDYKFGSTDRVVPPRPVNAPRREPLPPSDPIKSGDDIIMCIAQTRPFH